MDRHYAHTPTVDGHYTDTVTTFCFCMCLGDKLLFVAKMNKTINLLKKKEDQW